MKNVVVTGVSSGIGRGTARVLLARGFRVFGSVRQAHDAERLQAEFGPHFQPLLFDVLDEAAVKRAAEEVAQRLAGETLTGLVNNAGMALAGPLLYQPLDHFRQQMEVNVVGPLIAARAFTPLLRANEKTKAGRIVNISSVGGRMAAPFLGAYAASKHALEGMSESLRRELMLYGIDVILIAPGSVATPTWDKAEAAGTEQYADTPYAGPLKKFVDYMVMNGRKGYPPERVGEVIFTALTAAKPRVRYDVIPQKLKNWTVPTALPRRWLDRLIAGQIGLRQIPPTERPGRL